MKPRSPSQSPVVKSMSAQQDKQPVNNYRVLYRNYNHQEWQTKYCSTLQEACSRRDALRMRYAQVRVQNWNSHEGCYIG